MPGGARAAGAASVPVVLHPVGPLPAAVYWRRRAWVLLVLLALLGGAAWAGWTLWTGPAGASTTPVASTRDSAPEVPRLDRVVPSVAGVRTPTPPVAPTSTSAPSSAPAADTPCTDDMIGLEVRAPATVAVGSKPTLELVVTNTSPAPCRRVLDKGLQEIVLLDAAGTRVWGSNDCFPEQTSDTRVLQPGESVTFPVLWGGLRSEPTCTAPRTPPVPGSYVLRGRLDTKTSGDSPVQLG